MSSRTLILYHGSCLDGFAAAWAARRYFGGNAEYMAVKYGEEPPDVTGKRVHILDFSYPRAKLIEMNDKASGLIVLDHHKTAQEDLAGLDFAEFDMNHSGCVLSWRYFFDAPVPDLLLHVQDRDLWRFRLPGTKEVCLALYELIGFDFDEWDRLFANPIHIDHLKSIGTALVKIQTNHLDKAIKHKHEVIIDGIKISACNALPNLSSELGNMLAKDNVNGIGLVYYFDGITSKWRYSLRSIGDVDVTPIAKLFDGGGHRNAAGFESVYNPFELK